MTDPKRLRILRDVRQPKTYTDYDSTKRNNRIQLKQLMRKYLLIVLTLSFFGPAAQAQNWEAVMLPTEDDITGIEFISPDTGFLSIASGEIGRTYDGGATWTIHPVALDLSLEDISFANADLGLVCGKNGVLFRTTDGGTIWESVSPVPGDTGVSFFSVEFFDSRTALVTGMSREEETAYAGIAYLTNDRGVTWSLLDPMGLGYSEILYSPETGVAFPAFGLVNRSMDKGKTWRQISAIEDGLSRDIAIAGDLIVLVGPNGFIGVSRDGGKTWTKTEQDPGRTFLTVAAIADRTIYVGGTKALMLHSSDGGETWNQDLLARSFDVFDLEHVGNRLFAVGSDGAVIFKELSR